MGQLFFYKPLDKATKFIFSSIIKRPCQPVLSLLGWLVRFWVEMEILGLLMLWQDHFQRCGESRPSDVGTISIQRHWLWSVPPFHNGPTGHLFHVPWGIMLTMELWSYFTLSGILGNVMKTLKCLKTGGNGLCYVGKCSAGFWREQELVHPPSEHCTNLHVYLLQRRQSDPHEKHKLPWKE